MSEQQVLIARPQKSQVTGTVLTLMFGPLGLLYASPVGSLVLIIVGVVLGFLTFGVGALLVWPVAILWSILAISMSNSQGSEAKAPDSQ